FRRDLFGCARRALAGDAIEPTHRRVVIMRSGVNDDIAVIVVRQIDIFLVAAESKLKDTHARKAEAITQLLDIGSNDAEVFGDDWKLAQRFPNRTEKFLAWHLDPTTALGRLIAPGDFPAGRETAKVIDARYVHDLQNRPHAFDPPLEAIFQHSFPVVEGIAPELSGRAEIIRRDARDNCRNTIAIKFELLRIGPNVGRIMGHKDRYIADQTDAPFIAIAFQLEPLLKKKELGKLVRFNSLVKFVSRARQSLRFTPNGRPFPFMPGFAAVLSFQGSEQGVVVQPG